MMESPTQVERGTQVVTIQPQETVLTAFPYRPQITLLDFLKGEPKVLATVQILLALIIAGIGAIFAFNYAKFFHVFPLVFFIGYPFWGAFIFIFTGCVTGTKEKKSQTCLGPCVLFMNIISSLAAVAGITLTIISYKDEHEDCQTPSLVGVCVLGRTLLIGILSVLLIISIAEFSISVTILSFRNKCWTKSNEIVFFLPSDVTQSNELRAPEANAQLKFELQEESSSDDTRPRIHTAFFGGYAFFKLRVSASSLASQPTRHLHWKSKESYYIPSVVSLPHEHQDNITLPSEFSQEESELNPLSPTLQIKPLESTMNIQQDNSIEQVEEEDQQSSMAQTSKIQAQLPQAQDLPLQVYPSHSTESLVQKHQGLPSQELSSDVLRNQVLQPQALQFEDSKSHSIESHVSKTQNLTSQDMPFQNISSQDMSSQSLSLLYPYQQSSDLQSQDIQLQDEKIKDLSFQDIKSEVMSLTQEWKVEEDLQARKSPKRLSLIKGLQSPKRKSIDGQSQGQTSPKQKFLDRRSKDWQSPKKQYPNWEATDKQAQNQQHPDQQAEDMQAEQDQKKQSPKEQPQDRQDKSQEAEKKSPTQQTQDQQSEDQQAQEEKPPKGQSQDWQAKEQKAEEKKIPMQQLLGWEPQIQPHQDWRTQGWRDKDWKPQGWKFEVQHPLYWESQTWQAQSLLQKEALKQKALYQEAQTQHAIARHTLDRQAEDVPFQDSQYQDEHQQNLQPRVTQKEDKQIDSKQTKDVTPSGMESRDQKPTDLQLEKMRLNFPSSSCQDSVQDTHLGNVSNLRSEQDMQINLSTCSSSYKEDLNLPSTSYCPKDGQGSKDSK